MRNPDPRFQSRQRNILAAPSSQASQLLSSPSPANQSSLSSKTITLQKKKVCCSCIHRHQEPRRQKNRPQVQSINPGTVRLRGCDIQGRGKKGLERRRQEKPSRDETHHPNPKGGLRSCPAKLEALLVFMLVSTIRAFFALVCGERTNDALLWGARKALTR